MVVLQPANSSVVMSQFKNDEATNYDAKSDEGEELVKIICLGDSAVGKSKLVERFLMDGYQPQQLSTFALTKFVHHTKLEGESIWVDFWDTAGQERFANVHPSYYHQAHACILVFDSQRKITYKNLQKWYQELREYRKEIPVLCAANKIDVDVHVTKRPYSFPKKHKMPLYFVSASNGTNVVKLFRDAIKAAVSYKRNTTDFMDEVMRELETMELASKTKTGVGSLGATALDNNNGDSLCDSGIDSAGSHRSFRPVNHDTNRCISELSENEDDTCNDVDGPS